jgi:hypothetical protein
MTKLSPLQLSLYSSVAVVQLGKCPARDAYFAAVWCGTSPTKKRVP